MKPRESRSETIKMIKTEINGLGRKWQNQSINTQAESLKNKILLIQEILLATRIC